MEPSHEKIIFFIDLDESMHVKTKKNTILQIIFKGISLMMNVKARFCPKTEFGLVALTNTAILMDELTTNTQDLQIKMMDLSVQGKFQKLGPFFPFFAFFSQKINIHKKKNRHEFCF